MIGYHSANNSKDEVFDPNNFYKRIAKNVIACNVFHNFKTKLSSGLRATLNFRQIIKKLTLKTPYFQGRATVLKPSKDNMLSCDYFQTG